ncbi:MAG: nuclear transport factor 2 family protein [Bacteroidetes bacterium]|nr:nuclear transport factor 2 family protein [Bacteroidota bacterium]MBS1631883.1 nuclear transport factor 2 family protein [Bacteroidota bacterium]
MKNLFLFIVVLLAHKLNAQTNNKDKQAVLEKVSTFFKALEKKDTVLYKSIAFTNSQIWVSRNKADSVQTAMRYISDDIAHLPSVKEVIEERPLKTEINIHGNIAVVWVPYILSLSGKFSHCGIDVFTLLKTVDGWKIVSCVYSVEPNGCEAIKKEYSAK